jgi:hypothetical protein
MHPVLTFLRSVATRGAATADTLMRLGRNTVEIVIHVVIKGPTAP